MKLPYLIRILPLAAISLTILASSSSADDHDRNHHRKDHRRNHHDSNGLNIDLVVPGVTVDNYPPPRERTVIVEHERRYYDSNRIEFQVQRALARNGYYRGPIDGDVGYGTREAIRSYQFDYGLAPTGHINSELLGSLQLR